MNVYFSVIAINIIIYILIIVMTIFCRRKNWFSAWQPAVLTIASLCISVFVPYIFENVDEKKLPDFQLEYKKGEFDYVIFSTKEVTYDNKTNTKKIVVTDENLSVDLETTYRLYNINNDTATDVELNIYDYLIVFDEEDNYFTIPVEDGYEYSSYSYSDNYYEIFNNVNHVSYLVDEVNEEFKRIGKDFKAFHTVKFDLSYCDFKDNKKHSVWTFGDSGEFENYSIEKLLQHEADVSFSGKDVISEEVDLHNIIDLVVYYNYK